MQSYLDLLADVMADGEPHEDRTGVGTLSVFGRQLRHRMADGFPLLTVRRLPLRQIAAEIEWMLRGETTTGPLVEQGVHVWDAWATVEKCAPFGRLPGMLGPTYGGMWRRFPAGDYVDECGRWEMAPQPSHDQVAQLVHDLKGDPRSRRLIVTGWHPLWARRVSVPPCPTLWQLKVHADESLSLSLYQRSADIFLGVPWDIAGYALLLLVLCQETGRRPRDVVFSYGDLHLYRSHVEQARELLRREPRPLPVVTLLPPVARLDGDPSQYRFKWELAGYDPHPSLTGPVAV